MLIMLYKSLVRPVLEYASPVWSPVKRGKIEHLEPVQRRMTKIIPVLKKSYSERLKQLGLPTLEYRRLRTDLIQIYKIIHDLEYKPVGLSLELSDCGKTRGHKFKIKKLSCNTKYRQNVLALRTINWWNQLPNKVVEAENIFKDRLNVHFADLSFKFGE